MAEFNEHSYEIMHKKLLAKRAKEIKALYAKLATLAAKLGVDMKLDVNGELHLKDFPALNKQIDEEIHRMAKEITRTIEEGEEEQWRLANAKNDAMVDSISKKTGLPKSVLKNWKEPNLRALAAFHERKIAGMNLSQRVWNLAKQSKMELELALELGIGEGKSAAELTKDVRKYLNEPNKLFRRVRDEKGILRLSKAAAAYHPGRGVYRSSYKNALRLTGTENNIAYRSSDHTRWRQMPFVTGIRIQISNNHTLNGEPFHDICDDLQGVYPKEFKFTGWHPNCRCYATAELAKKKEFVEYTKKILHGEDVNGYKFTGQTKQLPNQFKTWVKDNQDRIDAAIADGRQLPYFLKDNQALIYGPQKPVRTPEQAKAIQDAWTSHNKAIAAQKSVAIGALGAATSAGYPDLNYQPLKQLIKAHQYKAAEKEALKVAQELSDMKVKEQALSAYIPDVAQWHKQFTLDELQDVYDAIEKKLNYLQGFPLEKQADKLHWEAYDFLGGNLKGVQQKYKTWQVSQDAYIKQLDKVQTKIKYQELKKDLDEVHNWLTANPHYTKAKKLFLAADKAYAAGEKYEDVVQKLALAKNEKAIAEAKIAVKKANEAAKAAALAQQQATYKLPEPTTYTKSAYTKSRKDKALWADDTEIADDKLRSKCGEVWRNASEAQKEAIYGYTYEYNNINEPLRGLHYYENELGKAARGLQRIPEIEQIIDKSSYDFDIWLQRGGKGGELIKFGLSPNATDQEIMGLVGKEGVEGAFTSAGVAKGRGLGGDFIFNIYAPKGTKMMYCEPFSQYGGGHTFGTWNGTSKQKYFGVESEILIQRGTKYRVTKVEKGRSGQWYIDLEIVEQKPLPFPYVNGYPYNK